MIKCSLFVSCILLCQGLLLGQSQIDTTSQKSLTNDEIMPVEKDVYRPCVSATLLITKLNQEVNAVAVECPGNYVYNINVYNNCKTGTGTNGCFAPKVTIKFGSQVLTVHQFAENETMWPFSSNFGNIIGFPNLPTPTFQHFTITVQRSCFRITEGGIVNYSTSESFELPFNVVNLVDNYYTKSYIDYSDSDLTLLTCQYTGKPICCNDDSFFRYLSTYQIINSKSTTTTGKIAITASASYGAGFGSINITGQGVGSYEVSQSTANTILNTFSGEIDERIHGIEGYCVFPGFAVYKVALHESSFKPKCNDFDELIPGSDKKIYIPYKIVPSKHCYTNPKSGCPPIPQPNIHKGGNFSPVACSGFIELEMPSYEGLSIGWVGPNGYESNDFLIEDLEIGTYNYTISNECCETITGSVALCDDLEIGPWEYNAPSGKYCRLIVCGDIGTSFSPTTQGCENLECVTPDEVVTEFNGLNCVEKHFYMGEFLGAQIISNPQTTISYNPTSQQCLMVKQCDNTIIEQSTSFPIYGSWNYDNINKVCTRAIFCFGQEMQGQNDTKQPVVQETFNPVTGLCEETIYCDGIPFVQPPSPPIMNLPWTWTEWGGCNKQVQCDINSPIVNVNGTETFYNWSYNANTNMCEAIVDCNNQYVPGAVHTESPNGYGDWDYTTSGQFGLTCFRSVYCGPFNVPITEYAPGTYVPTGIPCQGDYPGAWHYAELYCDGSPTGILECVLSLTNEPIENRTASVSGNRNWAAFPNPFKNTVSVSGKYPDDGSWTYHLLNATGQEVLKGVLTDNPIDASALIAGMYIIQVLDEKGVEVFANKIIKQ